MIISKWLRRTDRASRFTQPDRRPARRFTPCADGLEDRLSLSTFTISGGNFTVSGGNFTNSSSGGQGVGAGFAIGIVSG